MGTLLGLSLLATTASASPPKPQAGGQGRWVDADAPRRIRALAGRLETLYNWPGLSDFLVAVAYNESLGDPRALDRTGGSRGWFQLRPTSAGDSRVEENPELLFDERWAVVTAADYAWRLRRYAAPGQRPDWLAIRRGWKYPALVKDVDELAMIRGSTPSAGIRLRFLRALNNTDIPVSFMQEPAFQSNTKWPGIDAALTALGE